jgi:hypothetical protein
MFHAGRSAWSGIGYRVGLIKALAEIATRRPRTRFASSGIAAKDSRAVHDGNAPMWPRSTTTFFVNFRHAVPKGVKLILAIRSLPCNGCV